MKYHRVILLLLTLLGGSISAMGLTCPPTFTFSCKPALGAARTLCTVDNESYVSAAWYFMAPDQIVNSGVPMAGNPAAGNPHRSISILPAGSYIATYGFSFSGVVNGLGGDQNAYCFYSAKKLTPPYASMSFAGLFSVQYAKDPQNQGWIQKDTGYVCTDANGCRFTQKL